VLVVRPPPAGLALPRLEVEHIIEEAMTEAERNEIEGPATTPFLLDAISRLTNGRSLEVNLALLEQNAELAAEIACALAAP
jgi:pseudouridine-5'-phosphate glycosidase